MKIFKTKKNAELLTFDAMVAKVLEAKKKNKLDLSSDQDLSIALMNLISIEEHFFFSGAKTKNTKYYNLINEVRSIRKELLKKIIGEKHDNSERWCISKHLLATSMRLMEVGCKQLDLGNKEEAYGFFQKAYDLYALFWGINLEVLDLAEAKKMDADDKIAEDDFISGKGSEKKTGLRAGLGRLVQKVIDCCLE